MDRFIEDLQSLRKTIVPDLKSNMDRFIDCVIISTLRQDVFKIQYGQIYSALKILISLGKQDLKSNMDRFIEDYEAVYV